MAEVKSLRAFLALDPPPEVRKETGIIQNRLKKILRGDIRWTNPAGMHLTLKFFGTIFETEVDRISQTVGEITARVIPPVLEVKTVGMFPGTRRPRVIWLGIDGDVDRLVRLQEEIDRKLFTEGFPKEERPFQPHLTLARIRPPGRMTGLEDIAAGDDDYAAGSFTAAGLVLFKSDLTPRGALYTELVKFPFAG
jgi:RNA 2',3'-cyclic 3'-phosphodiesterase